MSDIKSLLTNNMNPQAKLMTETRGLQSKWDKTGLLEGLNGVDKAHMSILLENQAQQLLNEATATGTSANSEQWAGVALPLVRRVFAEISAKEFVSVQPMNLPSGLIFYLDFKYGTNAPGQDLRYLNNGSSKITRAGKQLNDSLFGVRLFGIRDDNRWQYNLAWFRRIDKDTNSGLNDLIERGAAALRDDDVFVVNAYYQDWPRLGFTVQGTILHNRNREGGELTYDGNGIIQRPMSLGLERPREYDVTYVGASGDGHLAGINLSTSAYLALGEANRGVFVDRPERIRAGFFAAELSKDFSWVRARASLAWASGDGNPFDGRGEGFDAILADVPCTGLGALRRRPEVRWRRTVADLRELTQLQRELADGAISVLKDGGFFGYATCSPHLAETSIAVSDILRKHPELEIVDLKPYLPADLEGALRDKSLSLWTHRHETDAMYLTVFRKKFPSEN